MTTVKNKTLVSELRTASGTERVLDGAGARDYLHDATDTQNLSGHADAIAFPETVDQVAGLTEWCWLHGLAITPRGGGTGYAGGCVPDGGLVVSTESLNRVRSLDPLLWRAHIEAGVTTRRLQRLARENGLYYPVDPGAAEQSQIGGNIATNAGGPHAFKYGVTGTWVTGLEVVIHPGEVIEVGGPFRKDVAGYDLKSLFVGSEGTLGILTAAHFKLIPAVAARLPVVGFYPDVKSGCAALGAAMASGIVPSAIEYLDGPAMSITAGAFPGDVPDSSAITVLAEADGDVEEAARARGLLIEALDPGALSIYAPDERDAIETVWRWREGVGIAVDAELGGKMSEDIAVPLDRLAEAIDETRAIGLRHDLRSCSWGHAGDGNLHSTFMFDRNSPSQLARAHAAAEELFGLALKLGGTVSGEHGLGLIKSGQLRHQWTPEAIRLHEGVKNLLDPKDLMNPGKKLA